MITTGAGSTRSTARESSAAELDEAIAVLRDRKREWAGLPLEKKIDYLRRILAASRGVAASQVAAAVEAKGLPPNSPLAAEEWLAGPWVQHRVLRLLAASLEQIRDRGAVRIDPERVSTRPDGQVVVEVLPFDRYDRLLFHGFRGDVWMRHEVTRNGLEQSTGSFYRSRNPSSGVALVLGAGNVASIAPLDCVHKLFAEGRVVLLKFHPVNEYLGPFVEQVFADLIRDGFVRTAYGGAEIGEYLCAHDGIDEIHITGSERTLDAIVFGSGEEGAARKAAGRPRMTKRITSELGNVGPMILVPGHWGRGEIRFHAENVATQIVQNGGFNCNATRVLITHRDWPQRDVFLRHLRERLRALPARKAYYPGAEDRLALLLKTYPEADCLGERRPGVTPPTIIPGLGLDDRGTLAFARESFCPAVADAALPGTDAAEFLDTAVRFSNEMLWGTLSAGLIVDPRTRRRLGDAVGRAVAGLRYGAVSINHWPALVYAFGILTWGAFPGHGPEEIQSGTGVVHNTLLFDRPQKSVVDGPFRVRPKPIWFVTHRNATAVARRMAELEADPRLRRIPGIAIHALRS